MSVVADKIAGDMFRECIPRFFIIAGIYVSICFVFLFFLKNGTM